MKFLKELKHTGDRRGSVHIIIAKDQDFFLLIHCHCYPVHCFFHILHQPWAMQLREFRSEKIPGFFIIVNPSLYQDFANNRIDFKGSLKAFDYRIISG